jgi:hypothetical protein
VCAHLVLLVVMFKVFMISVLLMTMIFDGDNDLAFNATRLIGLHILRKN